MRWRACVWIGLAWMCASALAAAADEVVESRTYALEAVTPYAFRGDVRDLPWVPSREKAYFSRSRPENFKITNGKASSEPEPANIPFAPMPAPLQSFAGMSLTDACTGGSCGAGFPPDINGDVGPNHYIEAVNSSYAIYSKTGTQLAAFTENSLWSTAGANPCNGNSDGDPVVLYDRLADRWILTHFAFAISGGIPISPFYQCIAASASSDPVSGGWWLYAIRMDPGGVGLPAVGQLNDYGKFGLWHDCLYMATNQFQFPAGTYAGVAFASFSRSAMYSGGALSVALGILGSGVDAFTMIPSNLLGTVVPAGTPNYLVNESGSAFAFLVRKFTPGPGCGAGGTLGAATQVNQTTYNGSLTRAPQPNTAITLDSLADRMMQKVQYRKVAGVESLWVSHTVQNAGQPLAPQWAQINVTGGTVSATAVQQQIYTPDATLWRWMPSLAVDKQGNMAMGYSTSNASSPNFPSIAYSGRLASDPLGSLSQTERQLVAGAGSQTNICGGAPCTRWGDYTAMSVDPSDECTFWYTNQYYSSQVNGTNGNWQTRIGSFVFPTCLSFIFIDGFEASACSEWSSNTGGC